MDTHGLHDRVSKRHEKIEVRRRWRMLQKGVENLVYQTHDRGLKDAPLGIRVIEDLQECVSR